MHFVVCMQFAVVLFAAVEGQREWLQQSACSVAYCRLNRPLYKAPSCMQALPDAASSAAAMVSGDVQVLTSAAAAAATAGVYAESAARIDGPWERN